MSDTQVLARKWRPKTFTELAGQEHVVRALTNALEQKRLHHAYLLTGTRGVGKTTLARILAKSLNCLDGVTSAPCGKCAACTEIDSGRFVDLIELDAASNTQVDNMRELLDNALYAPTSGRYKVYIIDEVHMLSRSAFNAMLKTLEEPPEHVKFILATTDPQKIPVTVLSRCLQFNLKQLLAPVIAGRLRHVLEQEGVPFEAASLNVIARAARGSMRDALSLLDQAIAYAGGRVEEAAVRSMLGAIDQGYLFTILRALAAADGPALMAVADDMASRSLEFETALQDLAGLLHRIALAQTVPDALDESLPERGQMLELAQVFDPEAVQLFYQIALHGRAEIGLAPDEYAGFTMALLRMLAFRPETGGTGGGKVEARPAARPAPAPQAAASGLLKKPVSKSPLSSVGEPISRSPLPSVGEGQGEGEGGFDGDWPALAARLKMSGMARMLAQHCELKSYDGRRLELCVPEAHRHLLDKSYEDKLRAALGEVLGPEVRVAFSAGSVAGHTPAELDNREKQKKQAKAIAAIEKDPFVRDMIEQFDAKLIDASIKPIQ